MINENNQSVLPMHIVDNDNSIIETIICDSISGEKNFVNEMPQRLSLVLIDKNGNQKRAEYHQVTIQDIVS